MRDPGPLPSDSLERLRARLAAVLLVTLTGVAAVTSAAACTIALLGSFRVLDPAPYAWLGVSVAGAAGVRLLLFAYARLLEPPDRRGITIRLR